MTIDDIMRRAPVIPVLVLDDSVDPVELAKVLVENGLPVIEVTLRTAAALKSIEKMRSVEGAIVGAGTVLDEEHLDQAIAAGAQFIVSPGLTEHLAKAAIDAKIPFLPGIANAGDVMEGLELGFDRFKFFPAEAAGGLPALKALTGPFGDIRFCPTGGITAENAGAWLANPAVLCVGGSWIYPAGETDLAAVAKRAAQAAELGR